MYYYWLKYTTEEEALTHLKELSVLLEDEDFVKPLDVVILGHVPIMGEPNEEGEAEQIGQTDFLVNCWGKKSIDFGNYAMPTPSTPICVPLGAKI